MPDGERNIHAGHRERVRNKYVANGIDPFEKHELLEMLLFYAIPQKNTNPLAHKLIDTFGSLHAVLKAPRELLLKVQGVTPNAATLLTFVGELHRYCANEVTPPGTCLYNTQTLRDFFWPYMDGIKRETVWMASLDHTSNLLCAHKISEGTPTMSEVSMRLVVENALLDQAASVVLAHNHPGGIAAPSMADIQTTVMLAHTLKLLGIRLVDHIILGDDGKCMSIKDNDSFARFLEGDLSAKVR